MDDLIEILRAAGEMYELVSRMILFNLSKTERDAWKLMTEEQRYELVKRELLAMEADGLVEKLTFHGAPDFHVDAVLTSKGFEAVKNFLILEVQDQIADQPGSDTYDIPMHNSDGRILH